MPRRYEAIRDSLVKKGKPLAAAKTSAAKIYNATRKPGEEALSSVVARERRRKQ